MQGRGVVRGEPYLRPCSLAGPRVHILHGLFEVPLLMNLLAPIDAAANAWDMSPLGPGLADRTPTPSSIIDIGPQRNVLRYKLPRAPSCRTRGGCSVAR